MPRLICVLKLYEEEHPFSFASLIDKPQCDGTEYREFCINRRAHYVTGECPGGSKELPAVPDKQAPRDTSHVPCTAPIYQTSYRGREVCMGGKSPENIGGVKTPFGAGAAGA